MQTLLSVIFFADRLPPSERHIFASKWKNSAFYEARLRSKCTFKYTLTTQLATASCCKLMQEWSSSPGRVGPARIQSHLKLTLRTAPEENLDGRSSRCHRSFTGDDCQLPPSGPGDENEDLAQSRLRKEHQLVNRVRTGPPQFESTEAAGPLRNISPPFQQKTKLASTQNQM